MKNNRHGKNGKSAVLVLAGLVLVLAISMNVQAIVINPAAMESLKSVSDARPAPQAFTDAPVQPEANMALRTFPIEMVSRQDGSAGSLKVDTLCNILKGLTEFNLGSNPSVSHPSMIKIGGGIAEIQLLANSLPGFQPEADQNLNPAQTSPSADRNQ